MATATPRKRILRSRIIERPRLYAMLDASSARVRTLIAPAGYGKTTLAEQWTRRDGRLPAWFTARRASADVAALALGIAQSATVLVPDCDARLRQHLRAVPAAGEHPEILAEIVGEDLASWPAEGWLVVDEYQELARSAESERFVAALAANSPVQMLIAGRQRPSWISRRSLLYGQYLELNQMALAMDSTEAEEVLAGRSFQSAAGLVALANGWPAVIGLASVLPDELEDDAEIPESLYRFFADEVFSALGDGIRAGLATLAVAPVLDEELAVSLLGDEGAEIVCTTGLDVGILVERGEQLDLHPLARTLLAERGELATSLPVAVAAERSLEHYRARRDWDAAFELIARHGPLEELEAVLLEALDELLDTARLSTLETWCELASENGVDGPGFALARAELGLRTGRHAEAQAYAESVAETGPPELVFRALSLAGRAAHLASREEEALALYRRAEDAAADERERRDARWGQVRCRVELGLADAKTELEELSRDVRLSDVRESVRAAAERLSYQLKFPPISLSEADRVAQLLDVVRDPIVESSFLSIYSNALALTGRYRDASLRVVRLRRIAGRHRLGFAIPYALCSAVMAYAGMRQWRRVDRRARDALRAAKANYDEHAVQFCYSVYLRALAQQARIHDALSLDPPDIEEALPAAKAEVLGSRSLVLAAAGRFAEAIDEIGSMKGLTLAAEPAVLEAATYAIVSLRTRQDDWLDRIQQLLSVAFSTGAVDPLVAAYRSSPELLPVLLRVPEGRDRFLRLIRRVGDSDLAAAAGYPIDEHVDPKTRLSPREREVFELLRQGLSNRQIAEALFISESTVKVHAHHIYDKLGTRSRTALAIQAALERASQATSATGGSTISSAETDLL